jgi:glycosyltransferase involved in cell wall biosynthesis
LVIKGRIKDSFAPFCSIVIRAFNEEKHIRRLLSGIQMQDYPSREIILVDSGSTDKTIDIANEFGAKIVNINATDFTFGRSLNRGIAAASGEIIVIISAHCYPVYPDWLKQLLAPFVDDQVAVSYGKQRGAESNHFSEHQFFRNYFPDISQPNQGQPFTHNANAAIRKSLWFEHAYNENLTGLEDLEWSSWAKQSGFRIAYVAEAEIIHIHEETFNQVHNRYKREAIAMKQILPKSRFTLRNMIGMTLRKVFEDLTQARRDNVIQNEIWNVIRFRTMQYLGTWQGYRYSGNIDQGLHRRFYYPPDTLLEKIPESRPIEPIEYQSETKPEH